MYCSTNALKGPLLGMAFHHHHSECKNFAHRSHGSHRKKSSLICAICAICEQDLLMFAPIMSETESILSEIKDTYVRLKPSSISGVGVFAIRDIPKGCRDMFTRDSGEWIKVPRTEVDKMPAHVREMVETYCTFDHNFYFIERSGFKKMDLCCYVNHSDTPNIGPINNGEFFEALVDIKKGEELFIDYGTVASE